MLRANSTLLRDICSTPAGLRVWHVSGQGGVRKYLVQEDLREFVCRNNATHGLRCDKAYVTEAIQVVIN